VAEIRRWIFTWLPVPYTLVKYDGLAWLQFEFSRVPLYYTVAEFSDSNTERSLLVSVN
jgi:hypothetical protein